jgi:hypothetical protein
MANTDITQRVQYERLELGHAKGVRVLEARSRAAVIAYMAVAALLSVVSGWLAIAQLTDWWQALVLAVDAMMAIGLMIAVSPKRPW